MKSADRIARVANENPERKKYKELPLILGDFPTQG